MGNQNIFIYFYFVFNILRDLKRLTSFPFLLFLKLYFIYSVCVRGYLYV